MKKKLPIIIKFIILILFIVFVVKVLLDYSQFKNSSFELKGKDIVYLSVGDKWVDPGFTFLLKDAERNDLVSVSGQIEYKEGQYNLEYKARVGLFSKTLTRTINVLSQDNEHFVLKLKGDSICYLMKDKDYIDSGVTAYDENDGELTNSVKSSNNVNSKVEGEYEVVYQVTNSSQVTKTVTRKVIVYSFKFNSSLKNNDYAKEEEITIDITDENYNYSILPNGQKINSRKIIYEVHENGIYNFKLYDISGNYLSYDVEIMTIDNEPPKGTCELSLLDTGGKISVQAKDNNKIDKYIYYYGSSMTSKIGDNSFSFNTMDDKASVEIFDTVGNSTKIDCNTVNKSTVIPRSYTSSYYNTVGYWLYVPKTTKREHLPILLYLHGDGSRGTDLNLVNNYAYPNFISKGEDFPFIMIAPQCHKDQNFTGETLMKRMTEIINLVAAKYNADTNRIIIAGGSSGAAGAAKMARTYKSLFSCLVIGSGVTYEYDAKNLTHLPIWIFHGQDDERISISSVKGAVERIKNAGGNVIFEIKDGGHGVTETAFRDQKLINWMISQVKK